MSRPFRLKHFEIVQDYAAMKIGTDALCLGVWCARHAHRGARRVLDLGTGTGILALMLAQAFSEAEVSAIEIDPEALRDCRGNFERSPYATRLHLYEGDALSLPTDGPSYDLIISNPPYFAPTTFAPNEHRARARTEQAEGLTLERLIQLSARLLSHDGELCLITPTDRETDLRAYAAENLLYPHLLCELSHQGGQPIRLISLWRRVLSSSHYRPTGRMHLSLYQANGLYSTAFVDLASEYLLEELLGQAKKE